MHGDSYCIGWVFRLMIRWDAVSSKKIKEEFQIRMVISVNDTRR